MSMPSVANSKSKEERDPHDFQPTPHLATEALLLHLKGAVPQYVCEPCCGEGHISKVLELYGYDVVSTDLIDRGYGTPGIDFLAGPPDRNAIITNPPFKHAAAYIEHVMRYEPVFFALLLKSTFWQADTRFELYCDHPPKLTLPLTWRLDFTGQGRPTMECTWFVWGQFLDRCEAPQPIRKPADSLAELML